MFLITKNFLKNINKNTLKENILKRCFNFSTLILENKHDIKSLPSSYWVRKIKGTNIFKFRLNSGDRILFTYVEDNRYENNSVLFLDYCNHDKQITIGKNIDVNSAIDNVEYFNINQDNYLDDNFDELIEKENFILSKYKETNFLDIEELTSIIVEDEYVEILAKEDNEDYLYYLTKEQFECIKNIGKPIIIAGGAGSGKTTVSLHKLLLNSNSYKSILYITYTKLLCNNAKSYYEKFKLNKNKNNNNVDFYYLNKLYSDNLGIDEKRIANFDKFKEITSRYIQRYKYIKKVDLLDIYTEYKGILKGYLGLEGKDTSSLGKRYKKIIPLNDYLNIPKNYSIFNEDEKNEIYDLCTKYIKDLKKEGTIDENDLAIQLIEKINKNKVKKFDYIMVDEVQDLTEVQIYMLIKLVECKENMMFCGDIHQIIHPTFFNFSRLRNIFYGLNIETQLYSLSKNYRSSENIINLLNHISKQRQTMLGKTKYDYNEKGVFSGEKPILSNINKNNIADLLKQISDKHYCAVIVPNEDERKKLVDLYPKSSHRIFLVNEIKGLEYDNVYCMNIISSNDKRWKQIYTEKKDDNFNYRYYFNLLYVSFSRARKNLFIYEKSFKNPMVVEINDFINTQEVISSSSLKTEKESHREDWIKEIKRLKNTGNTEKYENLAKEYKYNIKKLYYTNGKLKYEGEVEDNKANGEGIFYYSNGNIMYKGLCKNDMYNGEGCTYFENGNVNCHCEWKDGQPNGEGTYYYSNGNVCYKGTFVDGRFNGEGIHYYKYSENICYEGSFNNDKFDGKGIYYHENGNVKYKGLFKRGFPNGIGSLYNENGKIIYQGIFINGLPNGKSILYNENGKIIYQYSHKEYHFHEDIIMNFGNGNAGFIIQNNGISF